MAFLLLATIGLTLFIWLFPPRVYTGPLIKKIEVSPDLPVRFLVIGDTGTGAESQLGVAKAMEKRCNEAVFSGIIHVGDIFYFDGVTDVNDPQWVTKIAVPYGSDCLKNLPIYPILGNHDYRQNPSAIIERSTIDKRWMMPARFYSVVFGGILKIVGFDSNFPDWCFFADSCSISFLETALKKKETAWTFAFAHHPLKNSGTKHGSANPLFRWFVGNIFCEGADFYLAGHSHHLEFYKEDDCKTGFVISGAGGGDLVSLKENSTAEFMASRYGFVELSFTNTQAELWYWSDKNDLLFQRSFEK